MKYNVIHTDDIHELTSLMQLAFDNGWVEDSQALRCYDVNTNGSCRTWFIVVMVKPLQEKIGLRET